LSVQAKDGVERTRSVKAGHGVLILILLFRYRPINRLIVVERVNLLLVSIILIAMD
jgi:hypothetical protein